MEELIKGDLHHYEGSGLQYIYLEIGAEAQLVTDDPGIAVRLDRLHREIGRSIVMSDHSLIGDEFRFFRIEMDLSQREMAKRLDVAERTIRRWEYGIVNIPLVVDLVIRSLYCLHIIEPSMLPIVMTTDIKNTRNETRDHRIFVWNGVRWDRKDED